MEIDRVMIVLGQGTRLDWRVLIDELRDDFKCGVPVEASKDVDEILKNHTLVLVYCCVSDTLYFLSGNASIDNIVFSNRTYIVPTTEMFYEAIKEIKNGGC